MIRGNEKNHYALLVEGRDMPHPEHSRAKSVKTSARSPAARTVVLVTRITGETVEVARRSLAAGPVVLIVEGDLDYYEFFYHCPGTGRISLGQAPTTPFAYERTESFTGAHMGLYAHSTDDSQPALADFAWFEYQAL